jgi:hypothetical protein
LPLLDAIATGWLQPNGILAAAHAQLGKLLLHGRPLITRRGLRVAAITSGDQLA